MDTKNKLTLNGREITFGDERNLLELIRKNGIEIPTFCYHSELSIYGACRLCIVDIAGKGIQASCSIKPEPGMVVKTDTRELRDMRKIYVELLLANHKRECPSCTRSSSCTLQDLSRRLGVEEIRYKQLEEKRTPDKSSPSLERDPDKCVLCGDCVRVCSEVQGIGAIDFANRGAKACVAPAFDQDLNSVECVHCGQCAAVCPTGAIVPRQNRDDVWNAIYDPDTTVVAQIAPAVRVALGEYFGLESGENTAGRLVNALKMMGFDQVYDTCFAADMTIFEEANEFIERFSSGKNLPMFTSCCPGWVKFAETNFPEIIPQVSSCKSPQQMFGAVAKKTLPEQLGIEKKNLVVVSIMPCTAKKFEAQLDKFKTDGIQDVDHVLTTVEIARMISSMGIKFDELEPEAFDLPMGFATGAGVIFGATGGVMEAALRYAAEKLEGKKLPNVDFKEVRGFDNLKEAELEIAGNTIKVAVVHGLKNAKNLVNDIKSGKRNYDFVEVMACPGGCIAGAGQPITHDPETRKARAKGLYRVDKRLQLQKSQDNYMVESCYKDHLGGGPGSHEAHKTLHTNYTNRSQIFDAKIPALSGTADKRLQITTTICANQENCPGRILLGMVVKYVKEKGYADRVDVWAAFSSRPESDGTILITIGDQMFDRCDFRNPITTEEAMSNHVIFANVTKAIESAIAQL